MKKIQITFDCPDEETYLQVLGISKSFKEKLSGFSEVNIKEISSNPKEPEAVHGNEGEKEVLNDFISAIQTEFADMNWDYLPFIAERVLENRKNGLRCPPLS